MSGSRRSRGLSRARTARADSTSRRSAHERAHRVDELERQALRSSAFAARESHCERHGDSRGAGCAKLLIQFAGIHHYGFFRDELYYMACGEHLAWGYVDQPPLIAFVAWFARHLFGNSLFAFAYCPCSRAPPSFF